MGSSQLKSVSDEDLVLATIAGDRDAFAALVDRYAISVKSVAAHVLRDHHAAEDIAQETFVLGYGRIATLRTPSLFGRWICKIARHLAIGALRNDQGNVSLDCADEPAYTETIGPDTDHLLCQLVRLPERERRLLMLRYFNGHSVEEIARITGRPVGTVTKQLSRGYARLRERLAEVMI
jgi:RNA polymerase sigma-70 factor (ECF subfamily)